MRNALTLKKEEAKRREIESTNSKLLDTAEMLRQQKAAMEVELEKSTRKATFQDQLLSND